MSSMPPPAVFLIGLLADLLAYAPPGVGVLSLLVAHGLALRWRRYLARQGFVLPWIAFTSVARGNVAAAMCSASTSNILGMALTPLMVIFVGLVVVIFPVIVVAVDPVFLFRGDSKGQLPGLRSR